MDERSFSDGSRLVSKGKQIAFLKLDDEAKVIQFPELAVASYNKNPSAPNDPDGIVAVWNLHLLERPEFIFHSPVSAHGASHGGG